jgi:MFS family permease
VFISSQIFFYFLASILTGKISDTFGRKMPIQFNIAFLFFSNFFSSFASSYWEYFLFRMVNGFFHGVNDNLIITLAGEICTQENRALSTSVIYITWGMGQLFSVHSTPYFLTEIDSGNWRSLI